MRRGYGRSALRRHFVARQAFDGVSLALRGGLQCSDGGALVVYYEDSNASSALPTLHAWFGGEVNSHRVAAYRAIITWGAY